jgi:putative MATE family efflux protein
MTQATVTRKGVSGFFTLLRHSLRGEEQDYTQGSIRKAIFLLAVPMILEMMMESIFAVVDIFFVGKLGREAVSTVVLTESVITLLYSAAVAFSIGATAMVARRVGEKNYEEAARTGAQAINLGIIVASVISIAGVFFSREILVMMGASEQVLAVGVPYTRIVFGSSIVILLLFLINGVFRGAGNASIAMKSLWFANTCNIILCPVMIHFYGLTGAALATAIGRGLGVCFQLYFLMRGSRVLKIAARHFSLHWDILKGLFSISWVGFVQFAIASASWIFLARIMTSFGNDSAIAGYGVAIRIVMFFLLPAWGMSNAAATLVGQNLGAGQPDRAEESVRKTARYNAVFMGIVTVVFLLFARVIVGFMNKDAGVEHYAVQALQVISLGYVFYGVGMVLINAFNGAGDTTTPTIVNLFGFWFFQIPLAYLLARVLDMGPMGVFIAIPVAETGITLAAYVLFRQGKWKKKQV